ncbi:MAG: APC family permease, partial [Actinomycetota bacterium]
MRTKDEQGSGAAGKVGADPAPAPQAETPGKGGAAQGDKLSLRPQAPHRFRLLKRLLVGRPLATERLEFERLGKPTALAVFASDNLSSSAYATEEIVRVLVEAAALGVFVMVVPITLALLGVLGILLFSYRQTIKSYPQGGGAYLVSRDNFGPLPAQVAGVSLLTDYILTEAVSVSAGTAALTSVFGGLFPYRVPISLFFIVVLTWGNLRGAKEAGRIFAFPTYVFIAMMGCLLAGGIFEFLTGGLHRPATFAQAPVLHSVGLFVVLHAFSSGGAAVTGVEAISNGVPAFKEPAWRNARTTLMWMGFLLAVMFLGLSALVARLHIVPDPTGAKTVLAQVGRAVFGNSELGTVFYVLLQVSTMLILVLAANTSYAGFPRLASFIAADRYLPRQLTRHGDRLVYSNGIVVLAGLAAVLVVLFKASVTHLIPLYAIGVFTSFTFSQAGMSRHHRREREPGWRSGLVINAVGAVVSGLMTIIIASTKFKDGAWVILLVVPLAVLGLLAIHRHYMEASRILRDPERRPPLDYPRQRVVVPVPAGSTGDEPLVRAALAYARRVFPTEVRAAQVVQPGEDYQEFLKTRPLGDEVKEVALASGAGSSALSAYIRTLRQEVGQGEVLNIVIPETVSGGRLSYIVGKRSLHRRKSSLLTEPGVVVTNLALHEGYEDLEPGEHAARSAESSRPWRHVALLLVGGLHNAPLSGLRFARSLGADELHCLHIETDKAESEALLAEWEPAVPRAKLEILESPHREVGRPVFEWVRGVLDANPHTYVTIVIPEFLCRRWWHLALHNHT